MDPNATLARIRELTQDALKNAESDIEGSNDQEHEDLMELIELVEALDKWLSSGGFPPEAWHYDPRGDA